MNFTVAEKLGAMRRELHFDEADVARCAGISIDRIRKFELGALQPNVSELCALLTIFMQRFDTVFRNELDDAMAEVYARIAEYIPPKGKDPQVINRAKSYARLKDFLIQPHDSAL